MRFTERSAILRDLKGLDGGVSPFGKERKCDVCVNGMFLNYASYFGADEDKLCSIVDFLITEHMPDGGTTFCVHWTISVLRTPVTTAEWKTQCRCSSKKGDLTTVGPCRPNIPARPISTWKNQVSQAAGTPYGP